MHTPSATLFTLGPVDHGATRQRETVSHQRATPEAQWTTVEATMPAPFLPLTVAQFAAALGAFNFRRQITAVHMHHTFRPNHSQWRGLASVESMHRFHTQERGFSDIAQHLTIAPDGTLWTGRDWNRSPASASGHNGNAMAGPFMFETVGDFDIGRDRLEGAQLEAVLEVIATVNRKFNLPDETLLFHNQAAAKSCPGTSIKRGDFLQLLAAHRPSDQPRSAGAPGGDSPFGEHTLADDEAVQRVLAHLSSMPAARAGTERDEGELDCLPSPLLDGGTRGADGSRGGELSAEDIDALRPHVINLRMGVFSDSGMMTSSPADVDRIFHEHLPPHALAAKARNEPLRLLLFAHGGLVKESKGLRIAGEQIPWWLGNHVYPIHFVWETGLFETLAGLLGRAEPPGARGLSDLSDAALEEVVRALQGERIWGAMKASAQFASADVGGARYLVRKLKAFADAEQASGRALEVHAVGHSAGSIFHAHLLDAARSEGVPSLKTLQFLAPAVRVDTFNALVAPRVAPGQGADALTLFTMRKDFELDDHCAQVYRKSLLYLVSEACEPRRKTPLLGLEVSLRADAATSALFGLGRPGSGHAEVVWSKTAGSNGRSASQSTTHGGFDNDAPTMNSVLRRVLGKGDADPIVPFPASATRALAGAWADEVDWPRELLWPVGAGPGPGAGPAGAVVPALAPAPKPAPPAAAPALRTQPASSSARRKALCVGIDAYRGAPLAGCVNDARNWRDTLSGLGFEVELMPQEKATRDGLMAGLLGLFDGAGPGDELVFQFAGHGIQLPDASGDEAGGDTPLDDEALCPFDFDDGAFLIDDDVGAIVDRLADGANLTLFIDCCHSGTISRFGIGAPLGAGAPDRRARFMAATPERAAAHLAFRKRQPKAAVRAAKRSVGAHAQREVLFSACRSEQVAWESRGQGEFTLHATTLLRARPAGLAGLTHSAFIEQVVAAFGAAPRQTPQLHCDEARRGWGLLGARL
jgi:hypothetical protein